MLMKSYYDDIVELIYHNSLVGSFLQTNQNSKVYLMLFPLLKDFKDVSTYGKGSVSLAWLHRKLCRTSRIVSNT